MISMASLVPESPKFSRDRQLRHDLGNVNRIAHAQDRIDETFMVPAAGQIFSHPMPGSRLFCGKE